MTDEHNTPERLEAALKEIAGTYPVAVIAVERHWAALRGELAAERKRREGLEDELHHERFAHTSAVTRAEQAERERDNIQKSAAHWKDAKERAEADNAALHSTLGSTLAILHAHGLQANTTSLVAVCEEEHPGAALRELAELVRRYQHRDERALTDTFQRLMNERASISERVAPEVHAALLERMRETKKMSERRRTWLEDVAKACREGGDMGEHEKVRTLNQYQRAALRTATIDKSDPCEPLAMSVCALGLTGEAGEVADHVKKYAGHHHPLETAKVKEELGDTLWYIAVLAHRCGYSLEEVAQENVEKLRARYPGGFSSERSINRKEEP